MITTKELENTIDIVKEIEWITLLKNISPQITNICSKDSKTIQASMRSFKIYISISFTTVFVTIELEDLPKSFLKENVYEAVNLLNLSSKSGSHFLVNSEEGITYGYRNRLPYFRENDIPNIIGEGLKKSIESAIQGMKILKKAEKSTLLKKDFLSYEKIWNKKFY